MSSVKKLIQTYLATQIGNISVANSYNTDIASVVEGKILVTEKLNLAWRSACVQIRYDGQVSERDSELADSLGMSATARYICYVSMSNANDDEFLAFLDDVEAAVSKNPTCNDMATSSYTVLDVYFTDIDIVDTEEYDETRDANSQDFKELEATILVLVEYLYIADLLSGV